MNLFKLPAQLPEEELVETLLKTPGLRIERIVSTGQTSGWYNQAETEMVFLLQGLARLEYADGRTLALTAGDSVVLPAHQRHRVAYTSAQPPCVWLCVFYSG